VKRRFERQVSNSDIGELLATAAESATYPLQRALRRAGRASFLWPVEAAELARNGRSLTELSGVGPFLEGLIRKWLVEPQEIRARDELRRNFFTWPEAQKILQKFPDWKTGVRGDLQMHTEWSDGSGTIREMAESAFERGYSYIAITDHGKKLKIAGGMDEQELAQQGKEIEKLNEEFAAKSFRILRSIEMNLDPQGNGDMEPEALAKLDLVLGAFHSSLRRKEEQTERYLAALRNPNLHILGHPRGRIYNYRLGLKADWERVFDEAARLGKAVEIDCYPDRQDLSLDLIKKARDAGVMISLGTDSHHPWQLEFIDLGLAAAAQAKVPKDKILNFMSVERLLEWANDVRDNGARNDRKLSHLKKQILK
jgi:histidinol phosphatase-like PHP family hydrolase